MYVDSYRSSPIIRLPLASEGLFLSLNTCVELTDNHLKKLVSARRHELRYRTHILLTMDQLCHPDYTLLLSERLILEHLLCSDQQTLRNTCYMWGEIFSPVCHSLSTHKIGK